MIVERFEGGQWLRGDVISTLCGKVESDYVLNVPGAMMCVLKKFNCIIYSMCNGYFPSYYGRIIVYFTHLYFTTKHSIKAARAFLFHQTI